MPGRPDPQEPGQVATTYERLIEDGTFSGAFTHHEGQRAFFGAVMEPLLAQLQDGAAILEAGCGTGVWLEAVAELLGPRRASLAGFDLTPGMVELTRARLGGRASARQGNVLDDEAYRSGERSAYDLVYAFDVVQQLPRDSQRDALERMLAHVAPAGTLVVFDHDARSRYGRTMAVRKRLAGWGIPVLPSYYRVARYPRLGELAAALGRAHDLDVGVTVAPDGRKRAVVARRRA